MKTNTLYPNASEKEADLVRRFREAFVRQDYGLIDSCFAPEGSGGEDFGLHLGGDRAAYVVYEMTEFKVKCEKFGLTTNGPLRVFKLAEDRLYFYFGNEKDPALFEAVWHLNNDGKLKGNQSEFRWEPKMQSVLRGGAVRRKRVCNVKSSQKETLAWWRLLDQEYINQSQSVSELEDVMGGTFTSCVYEDASENVNSHWATWRIRSSGGGIEEQSIWMRGLDHPRLNGDTFPTVDFKNGHVRAHEGTQTVVILCVDFDDGTQTMLKYPEATEWNFGKQIKKVCLTDGLSYDWIVEEPLK